MPFTRRDLLADVALGLAAWAVPPIARAAPAPPRVLGFGKGVREGETLFVAAIADLDSGRTAVHRLPFFGHGVALDPRRPSRALVFEKKGPGACELDLASLEPVRPVPAGSGRTFYGHGTFTAGGDHVLAVEIDDSTHHGLVVVRDAATLRELGTFPTHGDDPHDCVLANGGKALVITNGGRKDGAAACVAFVDVASGKLLEKVPPASPSLNTGHVALGAGGDLVVISAPAHGLPETGAGGVTIRPAGGAASLGSVPPELGALTGEALSVACFERTAAVTHPDAGLVTFWDLEHARYLDSMRLEHPRGAVTVGERLVLSHGAGELLVLDARTRRRVAALRESTPFGGSHLRLLPA